MAYGWWLRGVTTWQANQNLSPSTIPRVNVVPEKEEKTEGSGREKEIRLDQEP